MRADQDVTETVDRRIAARAQIETAIDLFLRHRDHISAHVLTWAAVEMLRGIASSRNLRTFQETLEEKIKPKFVKTWRDLLRTHYNFAKHADRDPNRVVDDFNPEITSWALFGACMDYPMIFGQRTWSMLVFQSWFLCRHPTFALEPLSSAIPNISKNFDQPHGKPFQCSTAAAVEILEQGLANLHLIEVGLGHAWIGKIEY